MNSSTHLNNDIICFSLSRWDAEISSPAVSLAKEFSKDNRVFFIEHPFSLKDVVSSKVNTKNASKRSSEPGKSQSEDRVTVIKPPVVLPINFLPSGKLYNLFSSINNAILERTLRQTIKRHQVSNYIFINFFDPFFLSNIPADIAPSKYVYQCMDDMSEVAYTNRHGVRLENEIVRNADLVLCTSSQLVKLKSAYSQKVHLHPNAADFELFSRAGNENLTSPNDLNFGDKKVIGFTGSIEYRTDFALLRKLALHHKDKIIFLVGPVSGEEHLAAGLDKLSNVVFAGPRPLEMLPAYLSYFDCCIIPYKKNKLTASIYPLKINEYLAAGKPIVSTNFSEDIRSFSDVAYIEDSHEQFIGAVDKAIGENNEQKKAARIAAAAENTWTKRVEQFWQLVI